VNNAFRSSLLAFVFVCLCAGLSVAQTVAPTPDPFLTQITASNRDVYVGGISGNGRFLVFESTGNLANVEADNADGNREIFLYDYAQRRIFQITRTTSARVSTENNRPAIDPAAPMNFSNVDVEVSNNRPVISRDGRWIAFSSNAATPFSYDGDADRAALRADGNQEIFLYQIPTVADVDLRSGVDPGFINLRQNAFVRVTNTPASRLPQAGTATSAPQVADDNRSAQLNDRATRVVFTSTRNPATVNGRTNADANPEIFVWNRPAELTGAGTFSQITNTSGAFSFNDNPSISGDTTDGGAEIASSVIAFVSNATSMTDANNANAAAANADANAEIFVTTFNGATDAGIRQATRTRRSNLSDIVNLLNPGPRLSRNGNLLAFESVATDPRADTATNQEVRGLFIYNLSADTFTQPLPRAASAGEEDVIRFPVFTGDSTQLVFVSGLNFTAAGARVAAGNTTGLNPANSKQIYSVPVTVAAPTFTRLSNTRNISPEVSLQPFVSNTTERITFSLARTELGGGNADNSTEVFYLNAPPAPATPNDNTVALAYLTGATRRDVTPAPTPASGTGLAPGMIAYVRTTTPSGVTLAPSERRACAPGETGCAASSESLRRPTLPVELNGVSLSIANAAAGLYFVSPAEIQFVVPVGLAPTTGANTVPVVININENGAVRTLRSSIQIVAAQPDVYSSTNNAGGRAVISNVTNPLLGTGTSEPFIVTTTYVNGQGQNVTEATLLRVMLTGVRGIARNAITVRLVRADGTNTDITGDQVPRDPAIIDNIFGATTLDFRLPATLAGAGEVSIIIVVNTGGQTFTSRAADTAPRFRIN